ncbi:MAG: Do family serine endopeptidase [Bacteroidales bacterium]
MKRYGSILIVSILSSIVTFLLVSFTFITPSQTTIKEPHQASFSQFTSFNQADSSFSSSLDFTFAAEKSMNSVVHIKSTQKVTYSSNNMPYNPFGDLFDDEMFRQFFGPYRQSKPKTQEDVRVGTGSGVIIRTDGYIVTNNHVIKDADEIEVTLHDNRSFSAKLIGTDPSTDIAIIKIDETDLQPIEFENSDNVKVGEWVLAVGNPFNLNSTVTAGIVSAKARNINILQDRYAVESFIQTDAAINPGNSGGALVNLKGKLIGINTAIASPTGAYSGYGFAVPSNIVFKVINDLIEFGVVQRGFLGIVIRDVNSNLVNEKKLKVREGVYVEDLSDNSAAKNAGIKKEDVIVQINDIPIKSAPQLQEYVARFKPGDVLKVMVNRLGDTKQFDVILTSKTGSTTAISKAESDILTVLGIEISELNKDKAKNLKIDGGIVINKIFKGKIKDFTNIKEGFIITAIDKTPIKSTEKFIEIMKNKKGGVLFEGRYENDSNVYYYGFGM